MEAFHCREETKAQVASEQWKGLFRPSPHWKAIWVWLKIKKLGLRRFWSLFPSRGPKDWYHFFENLVYLIGTRVGQPARRAKLGKRQRLETLSHLEAPNVQAFCLGTTFGQLEPLNLLG